MESDNPLTDFNASENENVNSHNDSNDLTFYNLYAENNNIFNSNHGLDILNSLDNNPNITYRYNNNFNNITNFITSENTSNNDQRGIDLDRVIGYNQTLKDLFSRISCSVCTLIPFYPKECNNCSVVVCKQCITQWGKPDCVLRCGGTFKNNPSRLLRDLVFSLLIKCKNISKGCSESIKFELLNKHDNVCGHELVKCQFIECDYNDLRFKVKLHEEVCEFNLIKCKFCKLKFKKLNFDFHIEKECDYVLIECDKCGKSETRINLKLNHNCILSLKDEVKYLNSTITLLREDNENLKICNDDLRRNIEEDKRWIVEKQSLTNLYLNLLKTNYELQDNCLTEGNNFNSYLNNPMLIPYIFRFMTSSRTLQVTDLSKNSFFKINLSINFEIPTSHQSIVTSSKRVFINGGVTFEKKTYELDLLNKTLLEKADMNIGRRRHILTELKPGYIIATGGSNQNEEVLKECEIYILSLNKWIKIASLNIARFYHTAFSYNNNNNPPNSINYVYVIGGCNTSNSSLTNLNTIERIEFRNNEFSISNWEILNLKDNSLLKPRSRLSYLFLNKDKILLFGGIPDNNPVFFDLNNLQISPAENKYNIEGRFFFNDRCTWNNETLFISSQSAKCIFNHLTNCWESREFIDEN